MSYQHNLDDIISFLQEEEMLSTEEEIQVNQYGDFVKQLTLTTDSVQQEELVAANMNLITKVNSIEAIKNAMDIMVTNYFFDQDLILADSILTDPITKELYTAGLYYERFESERLPLEKTSMKTFNERIKMPYLHNYLLGLNNHYAAIQSQDIENLSSLKNTDHLEEVYDPNELFKELIEPYKGKVIYLDVWGTWCGPCRENMQLMVDVKDKLKDADIIFMYLANNSPQATWESVIKEMKLTGKNVVHYRLPSRQQEMIEAHFSINSYPTYMIIDKEGNVVNRDAPSPKAFNELMDEIGKHM